MAAKTGLVRSQLREQVRPIQMLKRLRDLFLAAGVFGSRNRGVWGTSNEFVGMAREGEQWLASNNRSGRARSPIPGRRLSLWQLNDGTIARHSLGRPGMVLEEVTPAQEVERQHQGHGQRVLESGGIHQPGDEPGEHGKQ